MNFLQKAIASAVGIPLSAGYGAAGDRDTGGVVTFADGSQVSTTPRLRSINDQIVPNKEIIDSNVIDAVQNNGFLAGAIETSITAMVGSGVKLNALPMWRLVPGGSQDWADDISETIEQGWASFTAGTRLDHFGTSNWQALQAQAIRSFYMTGEILAVVGRSKGVRGQRWRTKINLLDPSQLRAPTQGEYKDKTTGGIEFNDAGEPVAYHVTKAPRGSGRYDRNEDTKTTRIERFDRFGRQQVIHLFDAVRPRQARGVSPIAPVLCSSSQLDSYMKAVLVAAEQQTSTTAVIKADIADQATAEAIIHGTDPAHAEALTAHQMQMAATRNALYDAQAMGRSAAGNHSTGTLFLSPGDEMELLQPSSQAEAVESYSNAILSEVGRAFGLSIEQLTGDYRRTSYSSARMSTKLHHASVMALKSRILNPLLDAVYRLFLEELALRTPIMPEGSSFFTDLDALAHAEWMSPQPTDADPLKTAKSTEVALENRTTTLAEIYAAKGQDWRDALQQMKAEQDLIEQLGLIDPKATSQTIDSLDEPNQD